MFIIIRHWLEAASFFLPRAFLFEIVVPAVKRLYHALKLLLVTFWWLLLTEVALLALFGKHLFNMPKDTAPTPAAFLVQLIIGVAGLILSASLLLFIRKPYVRSPIDYIRSHLIRYIQISLFFFFVLFTLILIVSSFGISKLPVFHWSILLSLQSVELVIIFYWLDSGFSFKEVFTSAERGINFCVYNLPFFVIFILLLWAVATGVAYLFFGSVSLPVNAALFSSKVQPIAAAKKVKTTTAALLGFKYFYFLFEFFWISLVMVFYNKRKRISYTSSLFEK